MNQTISPGARTGSVCIPASKSQAHRLLICAALGAILAVVPAWQGLWTAIGAGRVLLYMLAWIIVPLALRTLLQK